MRRHQVFPEQTPTNDAFAADPAAELDVGVSLVVVLDQRRRRLEQLSTKDAEDVGVDDKAVVVSDVLGQLARVVEDQWTFSAKPRLLVDVDLSVLLE